MASNAEGLMQRIPTPRATERSQWYADLNSALGDAEKLLALLIRDGNYPEETGRLRQRIQIVQSELRLLNRMMLGGERVVRGSWPDVLGPETEL